MSCHRDLRLKVLRLSSLCLTIILGACSSPLPSSPSANTTKSAQELQRASQSARQASAETKEASSSTASGTPADEVSALPVPSASVEPRYTLEFRFSGQSPDNLTGSFSGDYENHYLKLQAQDALVTADSLAVTYRMAFQPWQDLNGQVLQAPADLPAKWQVRVYHANDQGQKHGFPVAKTEHEGEFSTVTWNGVTQEGKLAPRGRYVLEIIPEGFPQAKLQNVLSLSQFSSPPEDVPPPDYVPDQLLVKFKDLSAARSKYDIVSTNEDGWSVVRATDNFRIQADNSAAEVNENLNALAQALSQDQNVALAEPNLLFQTLLQPNDPEISQQYALSKVQAFDAWDIQVGQDNIIVAVVDTGIDPNHPDLKSNLLPGFNSLNNNSDSRDDHGHGTHVAGIAAGLGNNGVGIAGLGYGCRILPVKVLGGQGQGDTYSVANGIRWAVDQGAHVINLSLGGSMGASVMLDAVRYADSRGVVVVAAMGNDGGQVQNYPAAYVSQVSNLIAVGSTDSADQRSYFSNFGNWISVSAPGTQILSTLPGYSVPMNSSGQLYGPASGTSMATPYVAGLAALLKSQNPNYGPQQVKQAIVEGADDLGSTGFDSYFGAGRINAWKTLNLQLPEPSPTPSPTATPTPSPTPSPGATPTPAPSQAPTGFGGLILDLS